MCYFIVNVTDLILLPTTLDKISISEGSSDNADESKHEDDYLSHKVTLKEEITTPREKSRNM